MMSDREGDHDAVDRRVGIVVKAVDEHITTFFARIQVGPEGRDAGKGAVVQGRGIPLAVSGITAIAIVTTQADKAITRDVQYIGPCLGADG